MGVYLAIIDKTASFVAKNGREFEERILENERKNPKFSFLGMQDPYRPYYDTKVMDYKLGRDDATLTATAKEAENKQTKESSAAFSSLQGLSMISQSEKGGFAAALQGRPREPPRLDFLLDCGPMSSVDM